MLNARKQPINRSSSFKEALLKDDDKKDNSASASTTEENKDVVGETIAIEEDFEENETNYLELEMDKQAKEAENFGTIVTNSEVSKIFYFQPKPVKNDSADIEIGKYRQKLKDQKIKEKSAFENK